MPDPSLKMVEAHLSRVSAKLSIANRRELAEHSALRFSTVSPNESALTAELSRDLLGLCAPRASSPLASGRRGRRRALRARR